MQRNNAYFLPASSFFFPFLHTAIIIMTTTITTHTFDCDGPVFTGLVFNTGTPNELTATLTTGSNNWDADTEVKVTVKMSGSKVYDEYVVLCDYITSGCGSSGTVDLDLTSELPSSGANTGMMNAFIGMSDIKIKAKIDGEKEYCKLEATSLISSFQSAFTSGGAAKTTGFLVGTVALVGLAAYAVKRRNRSKSNNGADQKLNGGELA